MDAIAQIEKQAKQLEWALKEFLPLINDFNSQFTSSQELKLRSQSLQDAIERACPNGEPYRLEMEIATLANTVDLLKVMGYLDAMPLAQLHEQTAALRPFPGHVLSDFSAAIETISKHCEAQREETKFREQALKAIDSGVFKEWIERNPGRGASRRLGPYLRKARLDQWDDGFVTWTEIELFEYPTADRSPNRDRNATQWVSCTTDFHREANYHCGREILLIKEADAARIVLDSEESVEIEVLKWAKENAAPVPRSGSFPVWNKETRTLTFEGKLARKVSSPKATNVIKILDTFHEDGWPQRVDSPFPPDETTLRDSIKSLNSSISGLEFRADGTGEGIEWLPVRAQPNDDLPPF